MVLDDHQQAEDLPGYESYLRNWVIPEFGNVPVAALDRAKVKEFAARIEKDGFSTATRDNPHLKRAGQLCNRGRVCSRACSADGHGDSGALGRAEQVRKRADCLVREG